MLERKIINRLSKLHRNIRNYLNLDHLDFVSEKNIGKYLADEVNFDKKIIVEVNGDYAHANPKKFLSTDIIRLPGSRYIASERWEHDEIRKLALEKLGYTVFVIWESDDLEVKKKELYQLLDITL